MNGELITRVQETLKEPKKRLKDLFDLCKELCNHSVNVNCSSCITEGVMLLSNWVKNNNIELEHQTYFRQAVNGEYELKPLHLIVQVYDCGNEERQKELDACLRENKTRGHFAEITEVKDRLTYQELFKLFKKDSINVIANSDIYFDETILYARFMNENNCYALSRWDYMGDNMAVLFNRKDSQDAWIFNGLANVKGGEFCLGKKGCDNRIAFDIKQSGYNVLNPSKTIHAIHIHLSNLRTYNQQSETIPEPYHFIHPHF